MSKRSYERVEEFNGLGLDTPRQRMGGGRFQIDKGGERFDFGAWKVRRGRRRTNVGVLSGAVVTLIGFEIPGGDFGLVSVAAGDSYGNTAVSQQEDTHEDGLGAGGFGEFGFGA